MVSEDDHTEQKSDQRVSQMSKRLDLNRDEVEVLQDFEHGELASIENFQQEKHRMETAAREFFKKDQRINIRISSRDLESLQKKAAKEGLPYQTLIASTLHKFITGKLKPVN